MRGRDKLQEITDDEYNPNIEQHGDVPERQLQLRVTGRDNPQVITESSNPKGISNPIGGKKF